MPDVVFAASRFDHLYPKSADRELIRLLFGLQDFGRISTAQVHLVSPLDLYRVQMLQQIRAYSLEAEDEPCPHGRERLRSINRGSWTTHLVDVDSHGLGVIEFSVLALSVVTAEVALSATELSPDGQPAFFFDHTARGHEGLVLSGGEGGHKKCYQYLESLVAGVRGKSAATDDFYHHRRSDTAVDVLDPVSRAFLAAIFCF